MIFQKLKGCFLIKMEHYLILIKLGIHGPKEFCWEVSEKSGVDLEKLAASIEFDLNTEKLMPQSIVIAGTHKQVTAALHRELPDWDFDHLESYLLDIVIETPQYEVIPLKSFFENLKSKGFLLGVMTNDAEKSARAHLINAGVYSLLDFVAGSDTGYGVKPHAEPLLAFSKQTDLQPNEVAMVGDSLHDLKAAHAAGMVGIAVLTGMATEDQLKKHANMVFPSIAELSQYLLTESV